MKTLAGIVTLAALTACTTTGVGGGSGSAPTGWLSWRGPAQNGTSPETGLIDTVTVGGETHLWSYDIRGRGTPVVANGRVYGMGYENEGPELEEVLFCLDEDDGSLIWEHRFSDFLTDVIYSRYAIGSPTVDPVTGDVYSLTGAGLVNRFTADGELLWQRSMMEDLGRLSFPNGRVGAPMLFEDLVVVHFIFASWGPMGPARDRFFAFDKESGDVVWGCTPGGPPKDSSFSFPVVEERDGRAVMYAGLGGGHIVCVDVRTGDPIWRFPLAIGGVNSSALLYGDDLIVIHGKENVDSSAIGRMISLDLTAQPDEEGVLPKSAENWRRELVAFTSSPVLVEGRVYQTTQTGELVCVDADSGEELWHMKLGPDQLHASPLWADGKLYVPLNNGSFSIVRPSDEGGELLSQVQLEGSCLGAPAIANGRIYVHTTEKLYCLGERTDGAPAWPVTASGTPGEPVRLQFVPADASLRVGGSVAFTVRRLDAAGRVVDELDPSAVTYEAPPIVTTDGGAWYGARTGVATVKASAGGLTGAARVRVVPELPYSEDFESFELDKAGGTFSFPPGHWFGAIKWKVIDQGGNKVVVRRMENPLFQRTLSMAGHPDDSNYTFQADVMTDGNRRTMSAVGVVNQRYQIVLKGNHQEIEVSSNMEHLKVSEEFRIRPKVWYRLVTRVDLQDDGSAVVRAKAWPRDEAEPAAWTIEVTDPHGHTHGAAGVYGFTPQSRFAVYMDNLTVTPNE
jgi:outer membrane protein assembly factor BamB